MSVGRGLGPPGEERQPGTADIADFARKLVARGRILPALGVDEGQPVAFWRPVIQGAEVMELNAIIAAMPPVCRAESDAPRAPDFAFVTVWAYAELNDFVDADSGV
ncbi:hypothetical protein [Mycobacterium sp. DL440]|uniref:hypothetical protein n=1 Tax=Mycobacterium sp. DL440 TaxID=2675523 RepID=UPI00141EF0FF|nr:hypothetical protein [Mycobacterium sp. DL440]